MKSDFKLHLMSLISILIISCDLFFFLCFALHHFSYHLKYFRLNYLFANELNQFKIELLLIYQNNHYPR